MKTMSELYDSIRLTRSAATFTRALGIDAPDGADAPCDIVLDKLFAELGEGGADRVFIDLIAENLLISPHKCLRHHEKMA